MYYGASDVMYYGVGNPREEFVHYGLYPDLTPSVSDVMYDGVDNPEVFVTPERRLFVTPEELDIPDIDVTDVPPNVVYPEMLLRFYFYVMSSIT